MSIKERLKKLNLPTPVAIIGAGLTGKSFFDLLQIAGIDCHVFDESLTLPKAFSELSGFISLGQFEPESFADFATLVLSPGIDTRRQCFAKNEAKLLTDIELFARLTKKPLIGVTGTNGKSSVVSLIHAATIESNKNYALCGNIGLPVIKALIDNEDLCQGYIVELSSYHLERAPSLKLSIGLWLNVSPDHLDRYASYEDYISTKAKILDCCENIIANKDDPNVNRLAKKYSHVTWFSQSHNETNYFVKENFICSTNKKSISAGDTAADLSIFDMREFSQMGSHHIDNIMAVFAVNEKLGIAIADTATVCRKFKPLASRSVLIGEKKGVAFINDSKGTNVGATAAAISGIKRPIILIAGGQGKGQNFNRLAEAGKDKLKAVFLIGEDAKYLKQALSAIADCSIVKGLQDAVEMAISVAKKDDVVMLSPACASFDMFSSYLQRGEIFEQLVRKYLDE